MLPYLQLDDTNLNVNPSILFTNGSKIARIDLNSIRSYLPSKFQVKQLSSSKVAYFHKNSPSPVNPASIHYFDIFTNGAESYHDIKAFKKKQSTIVSFSQ